MFILNSQLYMYIIVHGYTVRSDANLIPMIDIKRYNIYCTVFYFVLKIYLFLKSVFQFLDYSFIKYSRLAVFSNANSLR